MSNWPERAMLLLSAAVNPSETTTESPSLRALLPLLPLSADQGRASLSRNRSTSGMADFAAPFFSASPTAASSVGFSEGFAVGMSKSSTCTVKPIHTLLYSTDAALYHSMYWEKRYAFLAGRFAKKTKLNIFESHSAFKTFLSVFSPTEVEIATGSWSPKNSSEPDEGGLLALAAITSD